jgi:ferric-dicitrate binding protein FerR (iron transport regulator)
MLLPSAGARTEDSAIGSVVAVKGPAWIHSGKKKSEAKAGDAIPSDARLMTDAGARMIVRLGNDVTLLLKERSEASPEVSADRSATLNLKEGAVLANVRNPEKRPDHFRVRSRAAVMGVRGTTFFVKSPPEGADYLCTCNGTLSISSLDGKSAIEITGKNHDSPRAIAARKGGIGGRISVAPMDSEHSDAEIAELVKALGQ